MPDPVTVGVSLKAYFSREEARDWFHRVADRVRAHDAVRSGVASVFVIPTYLQIGDALDAFAGTAVRVGAQDVSRYGPGAYTGEVTAAELAESGVTVAEIGHAERRRLFGETDDDTAAKASAALTAGITPVLCLGEEVRPGAADPAGVAVGAVDAAGALGGSGAVDAVVAQLEANLAGAPDGAVIVAYEPVWAIGALEPAPPAHISAMTTALGTALAELPGRAGSAVIYGGSAGPGLLTELDGTVDGLFLGRFAHHPDNLIAVLDEAAALAARR